VSDQGPFDYELAPTEETRDGACPHCGLSDSWETFMAFLNRACPRYGDTLELDLPIVEAQAQAVAVGFF